jgi:hypothetical protein
MKTDEKPRLVINAAKGEPTDYWCSLCGQHFIPPEDRSAREAAIELLAAFHEHAEEEHAQKAKD